MHRAYICSPLGGNVSENIENAKRYARYALECSMAPFIPHFYALILDESNKEERRKKPRNACRTFYALGLRCGLGFR